MSVDHIRYDLLVREALRGVVRRVIADVAKNGLPGDHHFYVSFDTGAEGVRISPRMKAQYPEEMTIVLQHQFWDLTVTETGFEVGLSFGGVPERLVVPFEAIKGFFDPSVQFGLEFETAPEAAAEGETGAAASPPATVAAPPFAAPKDGRNTNERQQRSEAAAAPPSEAGTKQERAPEPPAEGGAEVVRLDRFRKK